jgi:glucose-1-phosphate thymidylyltransferase
VKGIVLAGGTGSRLWPITIGTCKQLVPIYDKPLIYYPISTLMGFGIREILIISTPNDQDLFKNLLGDGNQWGVSLEYAIQEKPIGLADALIVGASFLAGDPMMLALGDNIFHSTNLNVKAIADKNGATVFAYQVSDASRYGVVEVDERFNPISLEEKPKEPKSNLAVTGLYYFDGEASMRASKIRPSSRGELEIISLIQSYLDTGNLKVKILEQGTAWLDCGTPQSLNDASNYVRILEDRTGLKIGCLEEIAFQKNWIGPNQLLKIIKTYRGNSYANYLSQLLSRSG